MPVGLVGVNAVLYPYYFFAAEVFAQQVFDLLFGQVGVSAFREQTHFRGQDGTLAVHVDGAALENEVGGVIRVHVFNFAYFLGHLTVLIPGKVKTVHKAAPCIEFPVNGAETALIVYNESGAAISDPCIVALHFNYTYFAGKTGAGIEILSGGYAYGNGLKANDCLGHVDESLLSGLCTAAPIIVSFGPKHPYAVLLFKFGRHTIAVLLGRGADYSVCHVVLTS